MNYMIIRQLLERIYCKLKLIILFGNKYITSRSSLDKAKSIIGILKSGSSN